MNLRSTLARTLALIAASLLAIVACGGETDVGTATSLDATTPAAPTTRLTSSAASASTTTTTASATTTTGAVSSTTGTVTTPSGTVSTTRPFDTVGRDLIGHILDTQWTRGNTVQIYLIADRPIGLTSGTRLPLARPGGRISLRLGLADWSDIGGLRGPYDREWDGELLLLDVVGKLGSWDRYQVRDQVSVNVPAGQGLVAAMCFEGDMPHAVELRFTDEGPQIIRAWEVDLGTMVFQPVDPTAITCPDLGARPIGPGAEGAIIAGRGRAARDGSLGDLIDLSGQTPQPLPFESRGGSLVGGQARGDDLSLSLVRDHSLEPEAGWLQLNAFLGWDYSGTAIWRVIDAVPLTNMNAVGDECWTQTGQWVVAITEEGETAPTPIEAWTVSDDRTEIVPVDVAEVTCVYLGD